MPTPTPPAVSDDGGHRISPLDTLRLLRRPLGPYGGQILAIYRSYENADGWAYPGDHTVAKQIGKSVRQMRRYRDRLLDAGLLVQRLRGPEDAWYRVVPEAEAEAVAEYRRARKIGHPASEQDRTSRVRTKIGHPVSDHMSEQGDAGDRTRDVDRTYVRTDSTPPYIRKEKGGVGREMECPTNPSHRREWNENENENGVGHARGDDRRPPEGPADRVLI